MPTMRRIVREPVLHFTVIGLLVFAAFRLLDDKPAMTPATAIIVKSQTADRLAAGFKATWRRQPNKVELAGLLENHVREEVLVREALALGLDRNDPVIRRRLRQKMEFLTAAAAAAMVPSEAALREHYARHRDRFRVIGRVALTQVFLGSEPDDGKVQGIHAALRDGANPASLGARTMLPPSLAPSPPETVDGVFGAGFYRSLADLKAGDWAGPVRSGYGQHLLRIDQRIGDRVPAFEAVREAVRHHWIESNSAAMEEDRYQRLRQRYAVTLPDTTVAARQ